MAASLASRSYGELATGETVEAWTLTGADGLAVEAITYGGIVTKLFAPDRHGVAADLVLGFNTLDHYLAKHPHFGAITGRVAGRTSGAKFTLEGKTYELVCNDPPNHLHGGPRGLDKRIWAATPVERADGAPSVKLSYHSPDGENNFPGNVDVTVTYTVTDDNVFLIETEAVADQATPINLTNHSYFNLAGEGSGPIFDHVMQISADKYVATDENMTLLGRLATVNEGNDFRQPRRLGDAIPFIHMHHGDMYLVNHVSSDKARVLVAQVSHPASGRVMSVSTNDAYLQMYTAVKLDGTLTGKSGRVYEQHGAVCMECHGYPDGVNCPALGEIVVRPGEPQRRSTAYAFSTVA